LTNARDGSTGEVALSNTETDWAHIKEPFLSASGADLNSRGTLLDPVSHVREGCGHNGAYNNLRSLYNLNMFFVFEISPSVMQK